MKHVFLLLSTILIISGCSKESSDAIKPTCSFSTPVANSTIYNGVPVSITISATNAVKVELYAKGILVSSKITAPFTFEWTPADSYGSISLTAIATDANNATATSELAVNAELREGDPYNGGVIFSLDTDKKHGLISALSDLTTPSGDRFEYGPSDVFSNATSMSDGLNNTLLASATNGTSSATYLAKHYSGGGFSDWFLPSINELELLKTKKDIVGGFYTTSSSLAMYWSSTESTITSAQGLNFAAMMGNPLPKYYAGRIRPIRKF